ncbi:hypothetical protein [Sphingomonas sp.]|uniref:hypothetical protein n=1 Tax=Sphingomonas sp. TaxID=28214 RepID=UPI001EB12686|nr:hypothetical protein [Sphingomonas sp.]MBX3594103.1 hypothetical protein [Sphingomonas sp.]
MRALFTKAVAGSMIASAALLLSACGDKTETTPENTTVVDVNATDPVLDGTTSDNMTMVDGATGNDMGMANDTMGNGM